MKTIVKTGATNKGYNIVTETKAHRLPIVQRSGVASVTLESSAGVLLELEVGRVDMVRERADNNTLSIRHTNPSKINIQARIERVEAQFMSIAGAGRYASANANQYANRKK